MSEQIIRLLSQEELVVVYGMHMKRDFPPAELKPLRRLLTLTEEGRYFPYGLFVDGAFTAYAFVCQGEKADPYVMLDYFAVLPEHRDEGVGAAFLKTLCGQYRQAGKGVFLEAECPDSSHEDANALRRRRLGFYERCGLRRAGFTELAFGVHYAVLLTGPEIDDHTLAALSRRIYHVLIPEAEVFAKNVVIPYEGAAR